MKHLEEECDIKSKESDLNVNAMNNSLTEDQPNGTENSGNDNNDSDNSKGISTVPEVVVPYITKLIGYPYAYFLLKPIGKVVVMVSYAIYLSVSIYGCTQLQQGLELQNLAPDDSYLSDFYKEFNRLFYSEYSGQVMVAITETLDYTSVTDLDKVNDLVHSFQTDSHFFRNSQFVEFWLYDYQAFIIDNTLPVTDLNSFIFYLQNVFLTTPGYDRFSVDIKFNDDNSEITASRFTIQGKGVGSTTDESDLMLKSRDLADKSSLEVTTYFYAFIYWDQYIVILNVTLINLGIAVISCLFASFLLVPSIVAVFMVGIAISSICVGVVGFMSLWGVSLDSISMINLVLCIGFSVDFSAHICYHYSATPKDDQDENSGKCKSNKEIVKISNEGELKVEETDKMNNVSFGNLKAQIALSQLGFPIIQGALSTILAVSILAASNSYIFRTFFKVIFLVMCFGFYHSMMLLPVVLAFFSDIRGCKSKSVGCS